MHTRLLFDHKSSMRILYGILSPQGTKIKLKWYREELPALLATTTDAKCHYHAWWAWLAQSQEAKSRPKINPFTTKCGQGQIATKFANFIFHNFDKQIASCESTGRELSFQWSLHRISSIDSKVIVNLQNSIKHSGSERVNYVIQNCK